MDRDLDDTTHTVLRAGREAWPEVRVDPARLAAWLRELSDGDPAALHAADLYLAAACLDGDPEALVAFDRDHLAPAGAVLRRAGYAAALVDETLQILRYRLLVAAPEREAKLRTYRGRGSLAGWVRITALRQARALLGPRVEKLEHDPPAADPIRAEVAIIARDHGSRIRELVRQAIGELDAQQREALRLEVVEGLPHHRIAELCGVHRTTVVRRVEDARRLIAERVRRALRVELAIGAQTADSLLRTLAGLDLSLASALRS